MTNRALADIITARRSIREYNSCPLELETVRSIIATASHAPSNNNRQGWKFFIISDRETLNRISRSVEMKLSECKTRSGVLDEMMSGYSENFTLFRNAPVVIICCFVKPAKFNYRLFATDDENSHFTGELISVSLAMQNIMLLAAEQDIGTLIMTAPLVAADEIKEITGIPKRYSIAAFICMGHYDHKPVAPWHKSPDEIIEIYRPEEK